jgi:uncharacterized protein YneF (UPF0154 family)
MKLISDLLENLIYLINMKKFTDDPSIRNHWIKAMMQGRGGSISKQAQTSG